MASKLSVLPKIIVRSLSPKDARAYVEVGEDLCSQGMPNHSEADMKRLLGCKELLYLGAFSASKELLASLLWSNLGQNECFWQIHQKRGLDADSDERAVILLARKAVQKSKGYLATVGSSQFNVINVLIAKAGFRAVGSRIARGCSSTGTAGLVLERQF